MRIRVSTSPWSRSGRRWIPFDRLTRMRAVTVLDGHVAHERLDDEVVVINLESGAYYALDGPAADCWTLLSAGTSIDRTVDTLAERHGADPNVVRADVDALAAELVAEGLVVAGPGSLD